MTLYDYIQSELINQGFNEYIQDGRIVFMENEHSFIQKILDYDEDVQHIVDRLFHGVSLTKREHDLHFKKLFVMTFTNRQVNQQTLEAFQLQLMMTFLNQQHYLNTLYEDIDKYITNTTTATQQNTQLNDGTTTSDNRQAYADLPQNNVQIDVDDTVMKSASDNTISRNKQTNLQQTEGETTNESKSYQFTQLLESSGLFEEIMNRFDRNCFLQIW